jgi:hypothetical protein
LIKKPTTKKGLVEVTSSNLSAEFQRLYRQGEELEKDIEQHLDRLANERSSKKSSKLATIRAEGLRDRAHSWFNEITIYVLPQTTFDRTYTNLLLRRLSAAINVLHFYEEYQQRDYSFASRDRALFTVHNVERATDIDGARNEVKGVIAQALRLIRTATTNPIPVESALKSAGHVSNTAFILMWMDKNHPELVDVHQAVKEVFAEFGIKALRADEIQHQDRITDLILRKISESELLFADLTGERPNVYYEVGYAHALGKRPILYRRTGTPLHFDLSIHNVPEYANVTQLRSLLRQRLEAITGRVPPK